MMMSILLSKVLLLLLLLSVVSFESCHAFVVRPDLSLKGGREVFTVVSPQIKPPPSTTTSRLYMQQLQTSSSSSSSSSSRGTTSIWGTIGQWVLDRALESPFWKIVMVPAARDKIIQTAQANGIDWPRYYNWLQQQEGPWKDHDNDNINDVDALQRVSAYLDDTTTTTKINLPSWYTSVSYHAYEQGHLCWKAALEYELASAAVGARNMPQAGKLGETIFRNQFMTAIQQHTTVPTSTTTSSRSSSTIVDFGCATGTSTRMIGELYPDFPGKIIGIDLSPYYVTVARRLLELQPNDDDNDDNTWVTPIKSDDRIHYEWQDATQTSFANDSIDIVSCQFVAHELPATVTQDMIREAHRILSSSSENNSGGQLWLCEMDFQSPAYAAQRANPMLFSLIRSTEPYLDEYADHQSEMFDCLLQHFDHVKIIPATGRHFAIVATGKRKDPTSPGKGILEDLRFDENGEYRVEDTHLQVWENKKNVEEKMSTTR